MRWPVETMAVERTPRSWKQPAAKHPLCAPITTAQHAVMAVRAVSMRSLYLDPSVIRGLPETCSVFSVSPLLRELILRVVSLGRDYPPDGAEARLVAVVPDELRRLQPEPLHLPLPDDTRLAAVTSALIAEPGDRRDLAD